MKKEVSAAKRTENKWEQSNPHIPERRTVEGSKTNCLLNWKKGIIEKRGRGSSTLSLKSGIQHQLRRGREQMTLRRDLPKSCIKGALALCTDRKGKKEKRECKEKL